MVWHEIGSSPGYLAEVNIVGDSCRGIRATNNYPDQWIVVKITNVDDGRTFRQAIQPNSGLVTRNFTIPERNQITVRTVPNPENPALTIWEIVNWNLSVNVLAVGQMPENSGV